MPLLLHLGHPITHLYPTHAEQFNQNINSQGFAAANLAWQSIELMRHYSAIALIFAVQSVDLRSSIKCGHYNARSQISPATIPLYEAIYHLVGQSISDKRPFIYHNHEQALDEYLEVIITDLSKANSRITEAMEEGYL